MHKNTRLSWKKVILLILGAFPASLLGPLTIYKRQGFVEPKYILIALLVAFFASMFVVAIKLLADYEDKRSQ